LGLQKQNGFVHDAASPRYRGVQHQIRKFNMAISARNVFKGKVTALKEGPINAEAEITTAAGDTIVATLTQASVKSLGLVLGAEAVAVIKTNWVTLLSGTPDYRFSARNQLQGSVSGLVKGGVNCQVKMALPSGATVSAMITNAAAADLGLTVGTPVTALFKASHVLVGVPV
jgi:molybdate transport system regulatory protein